MKGFLYLLISVFLSVSVHSTCDCECVCVRARASVSISFRRLYYGGLITEGVCMWDTRGGETKIPGIDSKKLFIIVIQIWNFSPLQSTAHNDWVQPSQRLSYCSKRCLKSLTEILSTAASGSHWTSATSTKRPRFGQKQNGGYDPPQSPDLATCDSVFFPGTNQDSKRWSFGDMAEVQRESLAAVDSIFHWRF